MRVQREGGRTLKHAPVTRREILWDWIEFRNGCPSTDTTGFYCLSDAVIEELLEESKQDRRWPDFMHKIEGQG